MATKKTSKIKPTRTEKVKEAKPKKEKMPREDRTGWGVMAFRMPVGEREALHKTAGPANASKVLRSLAGAFVTGDRAAFEQLVEDARKLQG